MTQIKMHIKCSRVFASLQTKLSIAPESFQRESKLLFKLAFPIFLAQLALTALGAVDTLMSGWSGTNDLAAIGLGSSIMLPVFIFSTGVLLAITPLVAKAYGKQDSDLAAGFLNHGILLSIPLGVAMGLLLANMQPILDLLHLSQEVYQLTEDYLFYIALGMPGIALYQALRFYWEGLGQTLPTMWISFGALVLNIPLNAWFIYGGAGVDAMGAAGCGVASALVMWSMFFVAVIYINKNSACQQNLNWKNIFSRTQEGYAAILKIGLPNALAMLFEVSLFTLIALFIAQLGTTVIAAQQIAINIASLAFMLPLSIGLALTVRIGQIYGEEDWQKLKDVLQVGFFFALMVGFFLASISFFLRYQLVGLYSFDPMVIAISAGLLLFAAAYQIFDAVQVATAGVLRGFHDTQFTMWVTLLSYWVIGLGLGYLLSFTNWITDAMGVEGFWLGIFLGLSLASMLLPLRLRWRLKLVYNEIQQSHEMADKGVS